MFRKKTLRRMYPSTRKMAKHLALLEKSLKALQKDLIDYASFETAIIEADKAAHLAAKRLSSTSDPLFPEPERTAGSD